jgi:hypothetical protein
MIALLITEASLGAVFDANGYGLLYSGASLKLFFSPLTRACRLGPMNLAVYHRMKELESEDILLNPLRSAVTRCI